MSTSSTSTDTLPDKLPSDMMKHVEGFCIATLARRPQNIPAFAVMYFTELIKFEAENPHLIENEVINEFCLRTVKHLPTSLSEITLEASQTSTNKVSVTSLRYSSAPPSEEHLICSYSGTTTNRSGSDMMPDRRSGSSSVSNVLTPVSQCPAVNSLHVIRPPLPPSKESSKEAIQDSSLSLKREQSALIMKETMAEPETEPLIKYYYRRPPSGTSVVPLEPDTLAGPYCGTAAPVSSSDRISKPSFSSDNICTPVPSVTTSYDQLPSFNYQQTAESSSSKESSKETVLYFPLSQKTECPALTLKSTFAEPEAELIQTDSQELSSTFEVPLTSLSMTAGPPTTLDKSSDQVPQPDEVASNLSKCKMLPVEEPANLGCSFPVIPVTSNKEPTHQSSEPECSFAPTDDGLSVPIEYEAEKQDEHNVSSEESMSSDEATVVHLHIKFTPADCGAPAPPLPGEYSANDKSLETQRFLPGHQETMSMEIHSKLVLRSPKKQLQSQGEIAKDAVCYQEVVSESQESAVAGTLLSDQVPAAQKERPSEQKAAQRAKNSRKHKQKQENSLPVKDSENTECYSSSNAYHQINLITQRTSEEISPDCRLLAISTCPQPSVTAERVPQESSPDLKLPPIIAYPQPNVTAANTSREISPDLKLPPIIAYSQNDVTVKETSEKMYSHLQQSPNSVYQDLPTHKCQEQSRFSACASSYCHIDNVGRESSPSYIHTAIPVQQIPAYHNYSAVCHEETTLKTPCAPRPPSSLPRKHGRRVHNHHHADRAVRTASPSYIPAAPPVQQVPSNHNYTVVSSEGPCMKTQYAPQPPSGPPRKHGRQVHDVHHIKDVARRVSSSYIPAAPPVQQVPSIHSYTVVSSEEPRVKTPYAVRPPNNPPRKHSRCLHKYCYSEDAARTTSPLCTTAIPVQQINTQVWTPTTVYVPVVDVSTNCIPFSDLCDCASTKMQASFTGLSGKSYCRDCEQGSSNDGYVAESKTN
ncbi:uncharacterized protein LOC122808408 [Protopterus annectens]|uniref:uncharacterized protein LOC122808408 n=1 Tax=Protopterus annectens TaxID=7888 RepID=UPI001CFB34A0|nr:uncharacterized protein LOC122808408 [Protopterus annectens]